MDLGPKQVENIAKDPGNYLNKLSELTKNAIRANSPYEKPLFSLRYRFYSDENTEEIRNAITSLDPSFDFIQISSWSKAAISRNIQGKRVQLLLLSFSG
jgi:hypothetical protein